MAASWWWSPWSGWWWTPCNLLLFSSIVMGLPLLSLSKSRVPPSHISISFWVFVRRRALPGIRAMLLQAGRRDDKKDACNPPHLVWTFFLDRFSFSRYSAASSAPHSGGGMGARPILIPRGNVIKWAAAVAAPRAQQHKNNKQKGDRASPFNSILSLAVPFFNLTADRAALRRWK